MTEITVDKTLDAKGLNCPMPVLKTKIELNRMKPGNVLKVIATDPGSKTDIPTLVKQLKAEMIEMSEEGGAFIFIIKK